MMSSSFRLALLIPVVGAFGTSHFKGSKATSLATNGTENSLAYTGVSNAIKMFEVRAPTQAATAGKAPSQGGKSDQPVGVQIEEKVMKDLEKDLSPACSKRYVAQMKGEGPEMHSFNQHAPDKKNKQCEEELQGSECSTLAKMTESQKVPDGRKMTAKTKVEGVSCLPKECTKEKDLAVLAKFMHGQTKEIFPDERIRVSLHVDCSAHGGAIVDANGGEPEAVSAPKSGAAVLFSVAPLLALFL
jgi:hypothetical protein